MVNYKPPVQIQAGVTPGFLAGVSINIFNGSNSSFDWRGWEIIPERTGFGFLKKGIEYTWDKNTGTWGLISKTFEPVEFYTVQFELRDSGYADLTPVDISGFNQYPHTAKIRVNNWSLNTDQVIELRCRIEEARKINSVMHGFNDSDDVPKKIVYFPLPIEFYEIGTPVEVYNGTRLLHSDKIKEFSKGQLNARMWL